MPKPINDPLLSIVIPVYNEEEFVAELVRRVAEQPWNMEIILIDDGSTDGTKAILEAIGEQYENARVYFQNPNQGKGAALHRAQLAPLFSPLPPDARRVSMPPPCRQYDSARWDLTPSSRHSGGRTRALATSRHRYRRRRRRRTIAVSARSPPPPHHRRLRPLAPASALRAAAAASAAAVAAPARTTAVSVIAAVSVIPPSPSSPARSGVSAPLVGHTPPLRAAISPRSPRAS